MDDAPEKGLKQSPLKLNQGLGGLEAWNEGSIQASALDELGALSAKNKLLWEAAKRRRRRPRLGTGAVKVVVTRDPALLES